MKLIKKIVAACLVTYGCIYLLAGVSYVMEQEKSKENTNYAFSCLMIGLPLTLSGTW
jgi:hypothetical protein